MAVSQPIQRAARILRAGGVVAYPTEGVFGLGCLPDDFAAVSRILETKERDPAMGFALIAADLAQLDQWIALPENGAPLTSSDDKPVTWIVAATDNVPTWIRGNHDGVAVRLTTHPVARALCIAADSALVSTSANVSGQAPARNSFVLRRGFSALVDYIVPGECGPASGPSEIRDLQTGKILRPA
jgi:L-threonylcarbamoyladenylate synthase